jgi:hypothetical protein
MDASLRIQLCFHFKFKTLIYFGGFKFHPSQLLISMSELNRQYKPHNWMEGDLFRYATICSVRCSEESNKRTCVGGHSYVIFVYAKSFCVWVLKLRQTETQFLHSDKLLINLYLIWTAWRSTLFKYSALHLHAGSLTSTWAVLGTHKFWTVFMAMPNVKGNFSHHGA